jgi:hypothetical protein
VSINSFDLVWQTANTAHRNSKEWIMGEGMFDALGFHPQEQILRIHQLRFWSGLCEGGLELRFQDLRFVRRPIGVTNPDEEYVRTDRLDVLHSHRVREMTIEHDQTVLGALAHVLHGPSLRSLRSNSAKPSPRGEVKEWQKI